MLIQSKHPDLLIYLKANSMSQDTTLWYSTAHPECVAGVVRLKERLSEKEPLNK